MPKVKIGITGFGSISALGNTPAGVWSSYQDNRSYIRPLSDYPELGASLFPEQEALVHDMQQSDRHFYKVDRSVLLALLASMWAGKMAGWQDAEISGVNIGSSRGATQLLERYLGKFLQNNGEDLPALSSPTTTLGNIATWVAYKLGLQGPAISHSITCSSALHALINGVSWLESGRLNRFLIGGSEAPLTPFTIQQMKALRIYAEFSEERYPCRAMADDLENNSMILGEGAACFCLESAPEFPIAWIGGIGYAAERIKTATGLSEEGLGLQQAMRMALTEAGMETVDALVCHTPGTRLGDRAELKAIETVFGQKAPFLTSNKWKVGHTLGASGGLSLEMALLMLLHNSVVQVPYLKKSNTPPVQVKSVMVNALGFGGNTTSVILLQNPDFFPET